MTTFKIATGLALPADAVTQRFAFIGRTGSGKSYAAGVFVEALLDADAQVVILDPEGSWWGLRLAADGKGKGYAIPVLGGDRGDIPLEASAGAMVADLVVDRGTSMVLDVSLFRKGQRREFVTAFSEQLFHRRKRDRAPMHVILEEAQMFVPQRELRGNERMIGAMEDLCKLGRKYGIGVSLLSQRPQSVHKDVLNQTEALFVFQTSGPQERKALEAWIVEKGLTKDEFKDEIPRLPAGQCWLYSPQWLGLLKRIRIRKKQTYDAGATPTFGRKAKRTAKALTPVDLEALRTDMASTIERAKADDPKELKKQLAVRDRRIRELERAAPQVEERTVEISVLEDRHLSTLKTTVDRMGDVAEQLVTVGGDLRGAVGSIVEALHKIRNGKPAAPRAASGVRHPSAVTSSSRPGLADSSETVSRSQQRILNALGWLESVGLDSADKTQIALLADQSPTSGGYFNNLGRLRSAGLIDYPVPGRAALTADGRAVADVVDVPQTSEELHAHLFARLSGSQVRILEILIASYPDAVAKGDLAIAAEQSPTSGGYFNNLGRLRSLGLIDYPSKGHAAALPVLFLGGAL